MTTRPAKLVWTAKPPTKEGWYWFRARIVGTTLARIQLLEVDGRLWMSNWGGPTCLVPNRPGDWPSARWAGPLPEPVEP